MNLMTSLTLKNRIKILHWLVQLFTMHRKSVYRNNKFEISASNWNEEFDLSKASYSTSDIQKSVLSILQKKTWNYGR